MTLMATNKIKKIWNDSRPFLSLPSSLKVSWIRKKDYHLLTVGLTTYSSDERFSALHLDESEVILTLSVLATGKESSSSTHRFRPRTLVSCLTFSSLALRRRYERNVLETRAREFVLRKMGRRLVIKDGPIVFCSEVKRAKPAGQANNSTLSSSASLSIHRIGHWR